MKRFVCLLGLLAVCSPPVVADLTPLGPIELTGSWTQNFSLKDPWNPTDGTPLDADTFDAFAIHMSVGTLEAPEVIINSPVNMVVQTPTPSDFWQYSAIRTGGSPIDEVLFALHFAGDPADVAFSVATFDDVDPSAGTDYQPTGFVQASYLSGGWQILNAGAILADLPAFPGSGGVPVPAPAAALLGVLGLSTAGLRLRRAV